MNSPAGSVPDAAKTKTVRCKAQIRQYTEDTEAGATLEAKITIRQSRYSEPKRQVHPAA